MILQGPYQLSPMEQHAAAAVPQTTMGLVESVADGDTIGVRIAGGRRLRVRLLGIDAPEINYQGRSQGWWAHGALHVLQRLCPVGAGVVLAIDRERQDKYGRLLAYVLRGGRNLNIEMVASGWAVPYQIAPNLSLLDTVWRAAEAAMRRGLGVYDPRRPLPLSPYEFRWAIDGRAPERFCGDAGTRRYVPPAAYRGVGVTRRVFFRTEAEAQAAGFQPAGTSALVAAGTLAAGPGLAGEPWALPPRGEAPRIHLR